MEITLNNAYKRYCSGDWTLLEKAAFDQYKIHSDILCDAMCQTCHSKCDKLYWMDGHKMCICAPCLISATTFYDKLKQNGVKIVEFNIANCTLSTTLKIADNGIVYICYDGDYGVLKHVLVGLCSDIISIILHNMFRIGLTNIAKPAPV